MKTKRSIGKLAKIIGIVVSGFFLLAIGPKLIELLFDHGIEGIRQFGNSLFDWYDNPTGFFTVYFVGNAIVWKNRLTGALIILLACILVTVINSNNIGWIIFTVPASTVGVLYLLDLINLPKSKKTHI